MLDSDPPQKPMLTFDVATAAIKGTRDYQEDSLISHFPLGQTMGYAVVADGIGGHAAGDIASSIVSTEVFTHLKLNEGEIEKSAMNIPILLREAAENANKRVHTHAAENDEAYGMGSTLLAPIIAEDKLWWLSIGDSPLLLFREGALRQLNKDHSMAPQIDMMIKMGSMTPEVGNTHPDRNTLTSVVNGEEIPLIDCPSKPVTLKPNDIVIAASDGLQSLPNAMIANTLMLSKDGPSIAVAGAFLAAIAHLENEDQDNTSITVIKVTAPAPEATSVDADDLPVLAVAQAPIASPAVASAPVAPVAEVPKKKKTFFYRGREYTKDE